MNQCASIEADLTCNEILFDDTASAARLITCGFAFSAIVNQRGLSLGMFNIHREL